jgi:Rps23 Pro-64 3,4-dihydroxylase Tpa1-like proline 4-hydroxylase
VLNEHLDVAQLAAAFRARSRLQIHDILERDAARAIHACLANEVPWSFTYRVGGRNLLASPAELAAMNPHQRNDIGMRIIGQAREAFTFAFMTYPMVRNYRAGSPVVLDRVFEALSGEPFLDFVRTVTGDASIRGVDAQATRYTAGHFLTLHDDMDYEGGERRYAYVLNFSDSWRAEWGGLLQFVDADGSVAESYVPHFNSLSLFKVPTRHIVSYVAPYAVRPRLAITGWFLA